MRNVMLGFSLLAAAGAVGCDGTNPDTENPNGTAPSIVPTDQGASSECSSPDIVQVQGTTLTSVDDSSTSVGLPVGAGALALDSTYVYWSEPADQDSTTSDVLRVPRDGGATERVTSVSSSMVNAIASDATGTVYVVDFDDNLLRVPSIGAAPTLLRPGSGDRARMAVDDDDIYLFDDLDGSGDPSPVVAVSKSTGMDSELAEVVDPDSMAIDGQYVYVSAGVFDAQPKVFRIPKVGGTLETLTSVPQGIQSIVVASGYVYGMVPWQTIGAGNNRVVRIPVGGGAPESIAGCGFGEDLALDGNRLYFSELSGLAVFGSVALDGTEPQAFDLGDTTNGDLGETLVDRGVVFTLDAWGSHSITKYELPQ